MTPSQNFLPIEDIKDDLVFLKNGSVNMVLSTSAVNFALLFETEQISIIESFAGLLNSLSFPIQISIISRRLDVSSYLTTLDRARSRQTNPQLKAYTERFRSFVESIIKENNVLDKQFYVSLSAGSVDRAATILAPRRDHVIKQLARLGIKARQLQTIELVKLFYSIYNPEPDNQIKLEASPVKAPPPPKISRIVPVPPPPTPIPQTQTTTPNTQPTTTQLANPFVVEELPDE